MTGGGQPQFNANAIEKIKIPLQIPSWDNDDSHAFFSSKSEELNIISTARHKKITAAQQYDLGEHTKEVSREKLIILDEEIKKYKKEYNLIDFNDMILDFTKSDTCPKFDVVFIDEAQDLSLMQWDMAKTLWKKSTDNYIAGDDDQAIFKWAGADVNSFITLGGEFIKLTQSYRIPAKVHEFAMKIINKVGNRIPKDWRPRTVEGKLSNYSDFSHIDMSKGDWLVLARTRSMLNDLENTIYQNGLYYKNKFKKYSKNRRKITRETAQK